MKRVFSFSLTACIAICLLMMHSEGSAQFGLPEIKKPDLENAVKKAVGDDEKSESVLSGTNIAEEESNVIKSSNDIILSTAPFEPGKESGKNSIESFNLGDALYGMAELQLYDVEFVGYGKVFKPSGKKGTLKELLGIKKKGKVYLTFGLYYWGNGLEALAKQTFEFKADDPLLNTPKLPIAIFPDPAKPNPYGESCLAELVPAFDWSNGHPKLEEGETNELYALVFASPSEYDDQLVASKKITVKNDSRAEKIYKAWHEVYAKGDATKRYMPAPRLKDEELEKTLLAAYSKCRQNSGEALRIIIDVDGWTIHRNELTGIILDRYIHAALAIKDKETGDFYVRHYSFKQIYAGDKFGPGFDVNYLDEYRIDQTNIHMDKYEE